jgi:hypothetical protein
MAISIVNSIPYVLQGDGSSLTAAVQLGYVPTSVQFVSAFNTANGSNVPGVSVTATGAIMTVTFTSAPPVAPASPVTVVVNVLPALPVLTQGTTSMVDGIKFTYSVASGTIAGNVVTPSYAPIIGQIFQLQGSASKVVRITHFSLTGYSTGTNLSQVDLSMSRRSTTATGGTSSALAIGLLDTLDPAATAVATQYTAAPTVGTLVTNLRSESFTMPGSGNTSTQLLNLDMEFGDDPGAKTWTLRGTSDFFTVSLAGTLPSNPLISYFCQWTEE